MFPAYAFIDVKDEYMAYKLAENKSSIGDPKGPTRVKIFREFLPVTLESFDGAQSNLSFRVKIPSSHFPSGSNDPRNIPINLLCHKTR